jgi:hypothetical protein
VTREIGETDKDGTVICNNERIIAAGGRAAVNVTEIVTVGVAYLTDGIIGSGCPFTAQGVINSSNRLGIECYVDLPSHYARNIANVQGCGEQISLP